MMKLIPLTIILFLAACGGGSTSDPDPANTQDITGNDNTLTVSNPDVELTINGNDNTITITSALSELSIVGNRNLLIFTVEQDLNDCLVTGSDNQAETNTGAQADLNCTVVGTGNLGFN